MPKAASFGAELMNSAIGAGAPWYTSGSHMWNGAAPSLKATPAIMNTAPVQAAGGAVDQRHAVQQQARGQRTEHDVLHRRFRGQAVLAVAGHQRVGAQRQQFQTQVDHQQAAGRDQDHHAGGAEQDQHRDLALEQVAITQVAPAIDQGQAAEQHDPGLHHVRGGIAHEHAMEDLPLPAHAGGQHEQHHGQRSEREQVGDDLVPVADEQVEDHQGEGAADQHQLGSERWQVSGGQWQQRRGGHHQILELQQLAGCDLHRQLRDRGLHQVGQRLGVDAQGQHADGEHAQHQPFAAVDVLHHRV
ncbi:hypothetical protein G6F57_016743 [Rhizopus arrhizus]|nr:hypothetical protein G6F57_016743 [Rhizopus arrhizus]